MSSVMTAKQLMRNKMKKVIAEISKESKIAQSQRVTKQLVDLPTFKNSSRIGVYLSMSDEIQTEEIVKHILTNGKQCFIPWYNGNTMKLVKLVSLEDYFSLPKNKWNIAQPTTPEGREDALSNGLDIVLVPGLAFTLEGDRLGRGKGYYDRFLISLSKCKEENCSQFEAIALAFREQIVDSLPTTPTDFKVHSVLYDKIL